MVLLEGVGKTRPVEQREEEGGVVEQREVCVLHGVWLKERGMGKCDCFGQTSGR